MTFKIWGLLTRTPTVEGCETDLRRWIVFECFETLYRKRFELLKIDQADNTSPLMCEDATFLPHRLSSARLF